MKKHYRGYDLTIAEIDGKWVAENTSVKPHFRLVKDTKIQAILMAETVIDKHLEKKLCR